MVILKIGLFALAVYLIFFAKKSPARGLGKSLGRFIAGIQEGLQEADSKKSAKGHADAEIKDARVLRKDIRE